MSEQTLRVSRSIDVSAAMPWLVAMAVYLLLMVLGNRLLGDADTYWHITLGRLILEHRALPTGEALSQTVHGTPLGRLRVAVANRLCGGLCAGRLGRGRGADGGGGRGGLRPVDALSAQILAADTHARRGAGGAGADLAAHHGAAARAGAAADGDMDRRADPRRGHRAPAVVVAHPADDAVGELARQLHLRPGDDRRHRRRGDLAGAGAAAPPRRQDWIAFAALALGAACVNPYGPELILATIRILSLGQALSLIVEWRPQDFSKLGAYEMVVLAAIGLALWRGVRLPPFRILMLLGVLHFSLAQSRHADLLGMLAPLLLARPLAEQFSAFAATESVAALRRPLPHGLLPPPGWRSPAAVTGASAARDSIAPAAAITPANAVNALTGVTRGPILNDYALGGYLDFVGIAPFIDGRTELYGEAFVVRYHRAVNLENLPDFLRLLDENRIEATLLLPATPAVALLDRLPDWRRVYADDIAVVHARRTPRQD